MSSPQTLEVVDDTQLEKSVKPSLPFSLERLTSRVLDFEVVSEYSTRRICRSKSIYGFKRVMRGNRFWLRAVPVPWWTRHHSLSQARPSAVTFHRKSQGISNAAQLLMGNTDRLSI